MNVPRFQNHGTRKNLAVIYLGDGNPSGPRLCEGETPYEKVIQEIKDYCLYIAEVPNNNTLQRKRSL